MRWGGQVAGRARRRARRSRRRRSPRGRCTRPRTARRGGTGSVRGAGGRTGRADGRRGGSAARRRAAPPRPRDKAAGSGKRMGVRGGARLGDPPEAEHAVRLLAAEARGDERRGGAGERHDALWGRDKKGGAEAGCIEGGSAEVGGCLHGLSPRAGRLGLTWREVAAVAPVPLAQRGRPRSCHARHAAPRWPCHERCAGGARPERAALPKRGGTRRQGGSPAVRSPGRQSRRRARG